MRYHFRRLASHSSEYYRERPAVSETAGRSYVSDQRERDFLYEECKEPEQEH